MNKKARFALVGGILGVAGLTGVVLATAGQSGWSHGGQHGMDMGMGDGPGEHRGGGRMLHMLDQLDTNKDKKLTQEEIDAARAALLAMGDADKNGELTLQEFESVWLEQMRPMLVRQFQRLDKDGNAQVTSEEFNGPFAGLVARLDRNDDKVLDKSDRQRRRGWRHRDRGEQMERAPEGEAPTEGEAPAEGSPN